MENKNSSNVNKNIFYLILVLIVIITITVLTSYKKQSKTEYPVGINQMQKILLTNSLNNIKIQQYNDIITKKDSTIKFIDLRNPKDYLTGHIDNAINIPREKIFEDDYKNILADTNITKILYYSDYCEAQSIWFLLTQSGYKNLKVLQFGYDKLQAILQKQNDTITNINISDDETAKYNFKEEMSKTSGGNIQNTNNQQNQPVNIPVKKKSEKKGGGC